MKPILTKALVLSFLLVSLTFGSENCECTPENEKEMVEAYNPPFNLKCCWNVFFTTSFIYWQPIEDGLNLAFFSDETSHHSTVKTDFDYKPGFKIGLGVNTHYDNWIIFTEYTRLTSHGHSKKNAADGESIFPLWIASTINDTSVIASKAKGEWELKLNILDLDLGRPYYVASKMVLNTFVGLRAIWIDQEFSANFDLTSPSLSVAKREVKSDSWGIGARGGIDATYFFYREFKVIGSGSASLFFQHYDLSTKFSLRNTTNINEAASDKIGYLTPNLDASLGIGWGHDFYKNKVRFDLCALYQFQIFWNQNMLRSFKDLMTNSVNGASGDLMLQGLTLTARFDF